MDENMPNMNGTEAMKKIREVHQERCSPIIALSASTSTDEINRFIDEGMDDFIAKPIDENLLYSVLSKHLG